VLAEGGGGDGRRERRRWRAPGVVEGQDAEHDGQSDGLTVVKSAKKLVRQCMAMARQHGREAVLCMRRPARVVLVRLIHVGDGRSEEKPQGVNCKEYLAE
jgi:hypothetical protein